MPSDGLEEPGRAGDGDLGGAGAEARHPGRLGLGRIAEDERSLPVPGQDRPGGGALEDRSAFEGGVRRDLEPDVDGLPGRRCGRIGEEERPVGRVRLVDEREALGREQEVEATQREADLTGDDRLETGARQGQTRSRAGCSGWPGRSVGRPTSVLPTVLQPTARTSSAFSSMTTNSGFS